MNEEALPTDEKNSNGVSVASSELSLRGEIAADAVNAIEVDHIVKKYGDFTAVDDVSFTVKEEEIFGLLGPNGAGKSTLIRMMTTLIPITGGAARIMGHDVARDRTWLWQRNFGLGRRRIARPRRQSQDQA